MTHKQTVTFTAPQAAFLRSEAERLGISFADAVRRIVDQHREQRVKRAVKWNLGVNNE